MKKEQAVSLKVGDALCHRPSGRRAVVIAPAHPKYVMIQWEDNGAKECPWIEWMGEFEMVG